MNTFHIFAQNTISYFTTSSFLILWNFSPSSPPQKKCFHTLYKFSDRLDLRLFRRKMAKKASSRKKMLNNSESLDVMTTCGENDRIKSSKNM